MAVALLAVGVVLFLLTIRSKAGRKRVGSRPPSPAIKESPPVRPIQAAADPVKSNSDDFSPELLAWAKKIADAPTEQDIDEGEAKDAEELEAIEARNLKQRPFLTTDEARLILSLLTLRPPRPDAGLDDEIDDEVERPLRSSATRILFRWADGRGAVITEQGLPELLMPGMDDKERREYVQTMADERRELLVALRAHFRARVPTERWMRAFVPTEKSRALLEAEKAKNSKDTAKSRALVDSYGSVKERPWDWFQRMVREGRKLSRAEIVEAVGEVSCTALLDHCRSSAQHGFLKAYSGDRIFFELDSSLTMGPSEWLRQGPFWSVRMLDTGTIVEVADELDVWFADYVRDRLSQKCPIHPSVDAWLARWDVEQARKACAERELRKEQAEAMREREEGRYTLHQSANGIEDEE